MSKYQKLLTFAFLRKYFLESFVLLCKYVSMKNLDIEKLSSLFKALSDENRMSIVNHLCNCSSSSNEESTGANVSEISTCCDVDFSVVSRHLSKLKSAGVLSAHKKGKQVFYSLERKQIVKQLRALADYIENSNCC